MNSCLALPAANTLTQGASAAKPRCSVKEAAHRMHKHPSTVYRMRRRPGPLRFVAQGKRIYVDLESLELFLPHQAPSDAPAVAVEEKALPERTVGGEPDRERASQAPIARESQQEQVKTVGWSGQRELIMPQRQAPLVILYMA